MNESNKGIGGICSLIFIIFLILKLAEVGSIATWSWWLVTSPLWLPIVAVIGFFIIMGVIMLLTFLVTLFFTAKKRK